MLLPNRVAIITGSGRGIGRGIAHKFAEEGCSIAVVDVLPEEGSRTAEEVSKKGVDGIFIPCDVSDSRQVKDMVKQVIGRFGKVDILVNNAGIANKTEGITNIPEEEWDRVLAINLKGEYLCCQAVVPHMRGKRYGKIINISSMAALSPISKVPHYAAAKAGILGLTITLAYELAKDNICVNAILPGVTDTDLFEEVIPAGLTKEAFYKSTVEKLMPMGRLGTPQDIAGAALFLASDLSGFVTGDKIIVAGGYPLLPLPSE